MKGRRFPAFQAASSNQSKEESGGQRAYKPAAASQQKQAHTVTAAAFQARIPSRGSYQSARLLVQTVTGCIRTIGTDDQ